MTASDAFDVLNQLLTLPGETETIEFKEAKTDFPFEKLGKYFSALSNEANLAEQDCAWLVFGVTDKRQIIGSQYRPNRPNLDHLKVEIADKTSNRITFIDIHEVIPSDDKRVVLFQIPPAPAGIPVTFDGHYYARDGESLVPLNIEEIDRIRAQSGRADWSAAVVPTARLTDLDPAAIGKARYEYKKKNPRMAIEVDDWDDVTFLNKARLTIDGQPTRTALLLLGRPESTVRLSPQVAEISWILRKDTGANLDYEHFGPPFLLEVDRILAKIRNLRYRYLPDNTLFPEELDMYDTSVIREALHNCIAHQDYTRCERVILLEYPEHLIFENGGSFIPGSIEQVIEQNRPQKVYRNKFLAEAMVRLDMIDTIGSGIPRMFQRQRERFFPMPDYDLTEPQTVRLRIEGRILDRNYTQLLRDRQLTLETVIWLDKVQKRKGHLLTDKQVQQLKLLGLIEGRKPNYHVSLAVARQIGKEEEYVRNQAFDNKYYKDMIVNYLEINGFATRSDIDRLLTKLISDLLTPKQKHDKITNLLTALRTSKVIVNAGTDGQPKWVLVTSKVK